MAIIRDSKTFKKKETLENAFEKFSDYNLTQEEINQILDRLNINLKYKFPKVDTIQYFEKLITLEDKCIEQESYYRVVKEEGNVLLGENFRFGYMHERNISREEGIPTITSKRPWYCMEDKYVVLIHTTTEEGEIENGNRVGVSTNKKYKLVIYIPSKVRRRYEDIRTTVISQLMEYSRHFFDEDHIRDRINTIMGNFGRDRQPIYEVYRITDPDQFNRKLFLGTYNEKYTDREIEYKR